LDGTPTPTSKRDINGFAKKPDQENDMDVIAIGLWLWRFCTVIWGS